MADGIEPNPTRIFDLSCIDIVETDPSLPLLFRNPGVLPGLSLLRISIDEGLGCASNFVYSGTPSGISSMFDRLVG